MSKIDPRARLQTADPKCANCRHWRKRSHTFGECLDEAGEVIMDDPMVMAVRKLRLTSDLTVCSNWHPSD